MSDDYLNQSVAPHKPAPYSHKNTIVWQFLNACKPGDGELGDLVRRLRDRMDMPRSFSHKTALVQYLHKCKVDTGIIARNALHLYSMYNRYSQQLRHPTDETVVVSIPPSVMARSGVTRKQIAIAVLEGLGIFSRPAENLEEGGRWADSAYGAADAVIALFISRAEKRERNAARGRQQEGF